MLPVIRATSHSTASTSFEPFVCQERLVRVGTGRAGGKAQERAPASGLVLRRLGFRRLRGEQEDGAAW